MKRVSVSEAASNLEALVDALEAEGEVLIERDGEVVARLLPQSAFAAADGDDDVPSFEVEEAFHGD